jgi:hypothetical protein
MDLLVSFLAFVVAKPAFVAVAAAYDELEMAWRV